MLYFDSYLAMVLICNISGFTHAASHAGKEASAEGGCQHTRFSFSHTPCTEPAGRSNLQACTNGTFLQICI